MGSTYNGFGTEHIGFYYNGGYSTINPSAAIETYAEDITDSSIIVGRYRSADLKKHGFYYNGAYYALDVPGSYHTEAFGINDWGAIVGYYINEGDPVLRGFI